MQDDIVVFERLSEAMLRDVARIASASITLRLAKKGIALEFADAALDLAAEESYDPAFGARPLRRWLEKKVVTDLSYKIIAGKVGEGSKVVVGAEGGQLVYTVTRQAAADQPAKRIKLASGTLDDLLDNDVDMSGSDGEGAGVGSL